MNSTVHRQHEEDEDLSFELSSPRNGFDATNMSVSSADDKDKYMDSTASPSLSMEKTKGNAQEMVIPVQLHKPRDGLLDSTGSGSSRSEGPVGGQGTDPQLDCPDGGLRAWLVVLGVSPRVSSSFREPFAEIIVGQTAFSTLASCVNLSLSPFRPISTPPSIKDLGT